MEIQEYLDSRVLPLTAWFTKNSLYNRIGYHITKLLLTITAAISPAIASFIKSDDHHLMQFTLGIVTVLTAILANISNIFNFRDKYITFRDAAEFLKSEKFLMLNRAGKYNGKNNEDVNKLFVESIEQYMISINSSWKKILDIDKDTNQR